MKQRKLLKTMLLLFCVAALGLFASCTKNDSGNGSGNGSNTSLIVGKWKCVYSHLTQTQWLNGEQYSFYEQDGITGGIEEFHSDGTTNSCVYSVQGSILTMCSRDYHIDKPTTTELHLTLETEYENSWDGNTCITKLVSKYKYSKM